MAEKQQNVGPLDRATRIILGIWLFGSKYFFGVRGIPGDLMGLGGAILVWEGLLGYCLLYGVFRWSTKRRNEAVRDE